MRGRGAQTVDRRTRSGVDVEERPRAASAAAAATGSWLLRGNDDRLTVYALVDGGVNRWTETAVGSGRWTRPDFFPVAGLTSLTVVQGANRYAHFLGRREKRPSGGAAKVDLVYAVQYQSGRTLGEWRSLGNPYRDARDAATLGDPAAAVDGQGTVHVFVSGGAGGVMVRRESKSGAWEAWQDLRGGEVVGGLAAAATSAGPVELLAPGRRSVMRWVQMEQGGDLRRAQDLVPAPVPGSAALLETGPGIFTAYWSEQSGTGVYAQRPGEWAFPVGGAPGRDPIPRCAPSSTVMTARSWPTRGTRERPCWASAAPVVNPPDCGGPTRGWPVPALPLWHWTGGGGSSWRRSPRTAAFW